MSYNTDWHEQLEKEIEDRTARLNELNRQLTEEIARRKKAEEALTRDNEDWVRIFNASSNLIMILDVRHRILRVNRAMAYALGMAEEEAIGRSCFELVHGKEKCPDFCPHARLLADGKAHSAEVYEPRLGGTYEVSVFPLLSQDGQILRSVHVARDITEEKRTQEKLRQQSEFLNNILNSLTHPFYVIDANDYTIVTANRAARLNDIIIGQKCYAATHGTTGPCSGPEHPCPVTPAKKRRKPVTVEHIHFDNEGGARNIEVHAYPILNAEGEVSQVIEYALDITERKKAEQALRESERRYRSLFDNMLGGLLYGKVLFEDGKPQDCVCLEVNDAFTTLTGLTDVAGRKATEVVPGIWESSRELLEVWGRVSLTGIPEKLETYVEPLGRWFSASVYSTEREHFVAVFDNITERKRAEEALERRVIALTRPLDESEGLAFEDLFNLDEIQKLQDQFAEAVGVASLITRPDGTPVTKPSNFCRLCGEIVRKTEKGQMNCQHSDSMMGIYSTDGPTVQPCLSVGLCNAGSSITVGGRHIANWMIGQVRSEMQDAEAVRAYARTIGADEEEFMKAFHEVPIMSQEQFASVAQALFTLAGQLSTVAYQNVQQARFIAERKKAEEALKESEERLRLFIGHAPTALAMFDSEMRYLAVSRRWMKDFRLDDCDIIGRSHYEVHPRIPDRWKAMHRRALGGEVVRADEDCIEPKHSPPRWLRWEARPWYTAEGSVGGIVVFTEEITERKQAEEARLSSERKYRTLFDESRDGVCAVLREGEITDANPSLCEVFGYTRGELIGRDIRELYVDPADHSVFQEEIENKGYVEDYEIRFRKKDGTAVDCLLTASVQSGDDGSIVGYRGILRDLTIRKRLQNQLFQAQKMEAIGTLAGGIAHDFNNLLQVVLGYTDMLILQKSKDSPDLRNLQVIRKAAKDGGELVKGLLTFSRQVESSKVPVDLSEHLKHLSTLLRRMIPKTIETELIVSRDLATVSADPIQLDQVLMNLAINAHHAMPGGGKITIEARNVTLDEDYCRANVEAKPGEHVMLKISDTGHGMEKEVLEHIFEPFFTTKEAGKGTGLGLAIVYGIVKNHDGHITCSSQPGQGTTFSIYFPVLPRKFEGEAETTSGEMTAFGTETILVVDDEEPIRTSIEGILTGSGYKVFKAENGHQGLEIYQERKDDIDLIVLDLNMPGMGGMECLDRILKIDPGARVLVASGWSVDESTRRILEAGASLFIGKPFEATNLLRAVRRILADQGSQGSQVSVYGSTFVGKAEGEAPAATVGHVHSKGFPVPAAPGVEGLPWSLRILAIDDRPQYLKMLEAGLAQFKQTLFTTSSGREGLQVFQETPVDVVICDLGMPELDGWAVGKRVKEICQEREVPKTPFILLTGETGMEDMDREIGEKMADCGVDAVVGKPVDIPDLLEVIERLVNKSPGSNA